MEHVGDFGPRRRWGDIRQQPPERMFSTYLATHPSPDEALRFLVALLAWPVGAKAAMIVRRRQDELGVVAEFMDQVDAWTDPAQHGDVDAAVRHTLTALERHRFLMVDADPAGFVPRCAWSLGPLDGQTECLVMFLTEEIRAEAVRRRADGVVELLSVFMAHRPQAHGVVQRAGTDCNGFTERQLTVLRLMAQDLTMRQIAARIGFSESTVRMESLVLYRTLHVHSREQAVAAAQSKGLLVDAG